MEIIVKRPSDCSTAELEAFKQLVLAGGEVDRAGLERRVKAAACLAFQYDNNGKMTHERNGEPYIDKRERAHRFVRGGPSGREVRHRNLLDPFEWFRSVSNVIDGVKDVGAVVS